MSFTPLFPALDDSAEFKDAVSALRTGAHPVSIEGLAGSAKAAVMAALARRLGGPALIIVPGPEAAERLVADLNGGLPGSPAVCFPTVEPQHEALIDPEKLLASSVTPEQKVAQRQRLIALERLFEGSLGRQVIGSSGTDGGAGPTTPRPDDPTTVPPIIVASVEAVLRRTAPPLESHLITLATGEEVDLGDLQRRLVELGYERATVAEAAGEFAVRGGLIDIFPSTRDTPVRIEFFGDEIESIREFDPDSQRSRRTVERVTLLPATEDLPTPDGRLTTLLDHLIGSSGRQAVGSSGDTGGSPTLNSQLSTLILIDEPGHARSRWEQFQRETTELALRYREKAAEGPTNGDSGATARATQRPNVPTSQRPRAQARRELAPLFADYLKFDDLVQRLHGQRVAYFTLLSQTAVWGHDEPRRFPMTSAVIDSFQGNIPELVRQMAVWRGSGNQVAVSTDQPHRVLELLTEHGAPATLRVVGASGRQVIGPDVVADGATAPASGPDDPTTQRPNDPIPVTEGRLSAGFRLPGVRFVLVTDTELFGARHAVGPRTGAGRVRRTFKQGVPIGSLSELRPGELVVHIAHGIGRYHGMVKMTVGGVEQEFLRIDYAHPDKLYVPPDQLDRVQRYIGGDSSVPTIHRLGSAEWHRAKSRAKARAEDIARELLAIYAAREQATAFAAGGDTVWQTEMEHAFGYTETPDQLEAIIATKQGLEQPKPMDRLVCGDVGYGKTEVAIRAAFKMAIEGKQVALLAPTTVLTAQHYQTFRERFAAFPLRIELLNRYRNRKEQQEVVKGLKDGTVDIVIGTHRLLSKDVQFKDLALLIVDEEQRFGVKHKEAIKELRKNVHVLTLTATPIPRTLHMSLAGIREMSVIEDPPEGRVSVRTFCTEFDDTLIRDALLRELDRGGQVFFVHNRIDSIYRIADHLQQLVPQARFRVGHGQMSATELEEVMMSFYEHEYDILVCTTIIESGIDIPRANTIIINNADRLGLSQLHQLRGRVGRSNLQAYCYLLYSPLKEMTEEAEMRLQALREFTDLGAGFHIAMRDLEIRGVGNLLGAEQSGHMEAIGFELYTEMLQHAVRELRGEEVEEVLLPSVKLPVPALIPEKYIPTEGLRIAFYKKIASCETLEDVAAVQEELEDRFGDPPGTVWNLLSLMRLRVNARAAGIGHIEHAVEAGRGQVTFWMARKVGPMEATDLRKQFKRAQLLGTRLLLYGDVDQNWLRPVEEMVDWLKTRAGKGAPKLVQRQLAAAEAAGTAS